MFFFKCLKGKKTSVKICLVLSDTEFFLLVLSKYALKNYSQEICTVLGQTASWLHAGSCYLLNSSKINSKKPITLCTLLKIQQLHILIGHKCRIELVMIPADWIETLVGVFTSEDRGLIFVGEKLLKEMQKIIRAIIKHTVK